jgi:uncharacterized iron-regulated membrane protein
MMHLLTGFFNNSIVTILLLLLIFAGIALIANYLRKWLWPATTKAIKVDPKVAVKEELARVLVPLDEPLKPVGSISATKPNSTRGKNTTTVSRKNAASKKRRSS